MTPELSHPVRTVLSEPDFTPKDPDEVGVLSSSDRGL